MTMEMEEASSQRASRLITLAQKTNPNLEIREEIIDQPSYIPERPGIYRPLSQPVQARTFPQQVYLEKGKKQLWDASGLSVKQPFCDGSQKQSAHANPSMLFKARDSGYTWLCGCKLSYDAPYCNATCVNLAKQNFQSRKGIVKVIALTGFVLPIIIGLQRQE